MNNKHRYKVLELPGYARDSVYMDTDHLTFIDPIFRRDGIYFDRYAHVQCWMEFDGGTQAVEYSPSMFQYELSLENHRPLSVRECAAILLLIRSRLAPRSLRALYYLDSQWKEHREVRRSTAKYMLRFFKEYKDE